MHHPSRTVLAIYVGLAQAHPNNGFVVAIV